jgi:endoglucanase
MTATSQELEMLKAVTAIPSAAGREDGVIDYLRAWVNARPDLTMKADRAGNLVVAFARGGAKARGAKRRAGPKQPPLFITAHMDHPAFVLERVGTLKSPGGSPVLELSFRGGVQEVFFEHAPITIHTPTGTLAATLTGKAPQSSPLGTHYLAELDEPDSAQAAELRPGDIATWTLPPTRIDEAGLLHTLACDDLAALAAALCAMDRLRALAQKGADVRHVSLLFTRSEEIGFIGAIAACRLKTIPRSALVIALENSRASNEAPIGAGPIVRVGDRLSIFTPWLTGLCCEAAEQAFGGPSTPTSAQTNARANTGRWQRKLMVGGACEASVFCHEGYAATCLCLPLGNYHNMAHLDRLQAGTYDATELGPPRAAPEFIHTEDFAGLVTLLTTLAQRPLQARAGAMGPLITKLYTERGHVLAPGKPQHAERASSRRAASRAGTKRLQAPSKRSAKRTKPAARSKARGQTR